MRRSAIDSAPLSFSERYAHALRRSLAAAERAHGAEEAAALGPEALQHGLGLGDLLAVHRAGLAEALAERGDAGTSLAARAADFLAAAISAFDLRLREALERETSLRRLNEVLKRQTESLKMSAERAADVDNARSSFVANLSHELRTPLSSIIGFSRLLLKKGAPILGEQDATYVGRVHENALHLLNLVNQILDLSKIESGHLELRIAPVSLQTLVKETMAQMESQVGEREVRLVAELPSEALPIQTDADRLKQVLVNLIGNAIKFTPRGSVVVRVEVDPSTRRPVRIDVADTGVGMARAQVAALFEPFQNDPGRPRAAEGAGLGLAISRSLCDRMGFRIDAASEPGKGSTFSVHLGWPIRVAPAGAERPGSESRSHPAGTRPVPAGFRSPRILVIDDESHSRLLLTRWVQGAGFETIHATSGEQGLRLAREQRPDLILLDLMMPRICAWDVLRALRADPESRDLPVVVVSVVARENRGIVLGAVDFLDEPVTRRDVRALLQRSFGSPAPLALLIEEDEDDRRLMAEYLEEAGARLLAVDSCAEAMERMRLVTPDLVIVGLAAPVREGLPFVDAIRRETRLRRLPVVLVSDREEVRADLGRVEAESIPAYQSWEKVERDLEQALRDLDLRAREERRS